VAVDEGTRVDVLESQKACTNDEEHTVTSTAMIKGSHGMQLTTHTQSCFAATAQSPPVMYQAMMQGMHESSIKSFLFFC
jgi:hypothetical protein